MLRNRWRAVAATAAISITAAVAPATAGATTITLSGSTSVAPLAAKLASKYVKSKKGVQFKLLQGGSDVGIADVSRGRVTLGMSSRDPKSSDPGGLVFNKIARDAICVVTNPTTSSRTSARPRCRQCSVAPFVTGVPSTARA